MIKKYSLVLIALLCCFFYGFSQLNPGDIAFLQMNTDGSGTTVKFVTFVDIPAGTIINFTDNGWLSTGSFRTG